MRLIALITLKAGADRDAFEAMARTREAPGIGALVSVSDLELLRATGVLQSGATLPCDYIEIIDVTDIDEFLKDSEGSNAVGRELGDFVEQMVTIRTERLAH